jgi:hypothetical protein
LQDKREAWVDSFLCYLERGIGEFRSATSDTVDKRRFLQKWNAHSIAMKLDAVVKAADRKKRIRASSHLNFLFILHKNRKKKKRLLGNSRSDFGSCPIPEMEFGFGIDPGKNEFCFLTKNRQGTIF